ncbi:MAG: hypothetical protein PHN49_03420 [Candidatus Omnitrophica bacterium]|nr:hypothetical protein [Candidatus Omnitrophota bacterium]MDD5670670.1 hypothetical protein [Candidatus Omnitrophota bacterium]
MEQQRDQIPIVTPPAVRAPSMIGIKVAIFLAFMISIVALVSTGVLYQALVLAKKGRAAAEAEKIQLQDQNETLQQEAPRYRSQISRMREQLKTFSEESAKLKQELDQRYIDVTTYRDKIKALEEKNSELEGRLDETGAPQSGQAFPQYFEEEPIPTQAPETPTATAAPTFEFVSRAQPIEQNQTEEAIQEAQDKTAASSEAAQKEMTPAETAKPQSVAKPEIPPAKKEETVPGAEAQVMTVNRKFNFVVVNMGLRNQLKMGDDLQIERDGKSVATVQVEKLYDSFAAAKILTESEKTPIQKGDTVRKG